MPTYSTVFTARVESTQRKFPKALQSVEEEIEHKISIASIISPVADALYDANDEDNDI